MGEFVRIRNRNGHAGMSAHQHPLENLTAQCSPRPLVWKLAEGRRQCPPANSIRIDRMTTRAISLSKPLTFDRVLRRRVPGKEHKERRGQKPDPDKAFQGRFPSIAMLQHSATLKTAHCKAAIACADSCPRNARYKSMQKYSPDPRVLPNSRSDMITSPRLPCPYA